MSASLTPIIAEMNTAQRLVDHAIGAARGRRFDEAADLFRRAASTAPDRPEVQRFLAQALSDAGRNTDAEAAWLAYLVICPEDADAHRHLGNLRRRMDKLDVAVESLHRAIELDSTSPVAHIDLGVALAQGKRRVEAKRAFARALELEPDQYDALINLGILLQEMREGKQAVAWLRRAVELRPDDPSGRNNLGVALAEQGHFDEAVTCYQALLETSPDYVLAWNNLGNALRSAGRNAEAADALQRALALKPDYAEAHNNLGIIHAQMEQFSEAIQSYDRALLLRPDYPEAHANRGLVYLLMGDFQRGWADYEWRWHGNHGLKRRSYAGKPWDGSPLAGKRILLYYEQGLGDTFQFIRYARDLKARGATVVFECQSHTRQILSRTPGVDEFVVRGDRLSSCDFYAPLLGLPGLFQTNLDTLPRRVPYVFPDPAMVWEWKQRLAPAGKGSLKVGIVWQGNPEHKGDRTRSIPLERFAPLAGVPGVRLYSLQRNFGAEQLGALAGRFPITDLKGVADDGDGWLRTAAIVANLDLVIGADTSVVHLAGAMGVPAWVALPTSPDWRWLLGRDDTPWYPTIRLFRQERPGDWVELFDRMATALAERVATPNVTAECEVGSCGFDELVRRATRHLEADELDDAQRLLDRALAIDPASAGVHQDLGVVHARRGARDAAIACFRRGVELAPDSPGLQSNLGLALFNVGRIEAAAAHLQRAVWLGAGSADTYKNLARALTALPEPVTAEECYWSALRLRPDDAEAHCLLAHVLLAQGKFDQGWLEHEWRTRWPAPHGHHRPASPRWAGQDVAGKRVLLTTDGDQKDFVQFARYADVMSKAGARVAVECDPLLAGLAGGCLGVQRVVPSGSRRPEHDFHVPLLSLPAAFGTRVETIPAARPYLGVSGRAADEWRSHMDQLGGTRIALALGHGPLGLDVDRVASSMAARLRASGLDRPVAWVDATPHRAIVGNGGGRPRGSATGELVHLSELGPLPDIKADRWIAIAAALRHVDLLVASDNLVAHVAAAMGIATWIILPAAPHYRWMLNRDDSPWYPTVRLFRQRRRGDWDDVTNRLVNALRSLPPKLTSPTVSGKTYDPITAGTA